MNKIVLFFLVIFLFGEGKTSAQDIVPSVSNIFRYGNGERILGNIRTKQTYFENLTDFRLSLPSSFVVGARLLYDNPPEIGETFRGISRRFIEYNGDEFSLRAGNSSVLFGRGLAINLFENRGLAFDTWMDGIKFNYKNDFLNASLLGGSIDYRDSVTFVRNEKYEIRGGNIEILPSDNITVGLSYIYSEGEIPQGPQSSAIPIKNIKAEIPEIYFSINLSNISLYLDWSRKWLNVLPDHYTSEGNGFYGAASYFGEGFGVTLDYKNYAYDIQNPFGRSDNARPTKMLPFQNPPIVQKEHSYTLLTRALHDVDFNDEVGFQVDVYYSVSSNTIININGSLSSIHNSYSLNSDGFTFSKIKRDMNFLPVFSKEFFPYYEFFIEAEHYYNFTSAVRLGFAQRDKTFFNEFSLDRSSTITTSTIIPLQIQHTFSNNFSLTFQSEHEWVSEKYLSINEKYFNHLITIIPSFFSKLTTALRIEYTTNKNEVSGRRNWLIGEIGYRITSANIISVSYGRERGGQICSNGVCRYIQPFEGFRMSIQSQL